MMRPATMPMRSPVAIPRGPSTGRYRKMDELSMSRAAIAVCATLCANPPADDGEEMCSFQQCHYG